MPPVTLRFTWGTMDNRKLLGPKRGHSWTPEEQPQGLRGVRAVLADPHVDAAMVFLHHTFTIGDTNVSNVK